MDDTRLVNLPRLEGNPTGFTIGTSHDANKDFIKNIRFAKGAVKLSKRVETEGKIIMQGIRFDVNKATLKAESMGPINKIFEMMKNDSSINFSVEGHTDSDGDDEANLKLSEARAKAVVDKLVELGIDASRLKYKGLGETMPIGDNSSPEGKANNRRVEFIKF
jgi:outer membrane protein OmpA-like peptidoglycan-associated protein